MRANIKLWVEKVPGEWGIVIIICLVAFASFGLGRLSMTEKVRPAVAITSAASANVPLSIPAGGLFVASKGGSSYHYPWCSGASKILDKNKVWFKSYREAQAAGYVAAKNCKGLGND